MGNITHRPALDDFEAASIGEFAFNGLSVQGLRFFSIKSYSLKQALAPVDTSTPGKIKIEFATPGPDHLTLTANVSGGNVSSFDIADENGNVLAVYNGFVPVDSDDFVNAVTNDNTSIPTGRFQYLVTLFDGATTATGSAASEGFEVGAGNDTVTGFGGDDAVFKWNTGRVNFNGGAGSDTLTFQATFGPYPNAPVVGAVVNLGAGTGTNPYDGTSALTLTSVENVIGTELADRFTGSNAANIFGDGLYDVGADIIKAKGGNDLVFLAEGAFGFPGGVVADGGTGIDVLAISLGQWAASGTDRLDLSNQATNTGVFANDVLTNFEVFAPGGWFAPAGHKFIFVDSNDNAGRTVVALGQTNILNLKGGNDTAIVLTTSTPANYSVTANGGAGIDTLQFEVSFFLANNVLDLANQAKNSGIFKKGNFTGFEVFNHVELDGGNTATQRFTFRGNGQAQTVNGALGIDNISLAGGNDTANGGLGNDILTGGAGKDSFVFNTALSPAANVDKVTDFSVKDDTFRIENTVFKGIGGNGVLAANLFHIGAHAGDGNDRIIYNEATGALLYDSNGSVAGQEFRFATLAKNLPLTNLDFVVI